MKALVRQIRFADSGAQAGFFRPGFHLRRQYELLSNRRIQFHNSAVVDKAYGLISTQATAEGIEVHEEPRRQGRRASLRGLLNCVHNLRPRLFKILHVCGRKERGEGQNNDQLGAAFLDAGELKLNILGEIALYALALGMLLEELPLGNLDEHLLKGGKVLQDL